MLAALVGGAKAEDCPDIEKFREVYRGKPFISLNFLQLTHSEIFESVDSLGGTLWAGRKGRFRLSMPGQAMVSNGILYWSYSEENQQVLVDSVARLGDWNPLTLVYDPEAVYECHSQSVQGDILEFDLIALDTLTTPRQFTMQVTIGEYIPQKLIYYDDNNSRIEVFIGDFSRPAALPDSLFVFRPPPGTEVIEMP